MVDHFEKYLQERSGISIIHHEHGFATYKQISPDTVYLIDIYIDPEQRLQGLAKYLSSQVAEKARELGCTKLQGTVDLSAAGVTQSLKAVLSDGFEFSHAQGNGLYFVKGI